MVPRLWREQALEKDDGECRQRRCRLRRRVSAGQASAAEGRNQVVGHQGERSDAAVFVVVAAAGFDNWRHRPGSEHWRYNID